MRQTVHIHVIGYLLIVCCALMLAWTTQDLHVVSLESLLLLLLTAGWFSAVKVKPWSARLIITTGAAAIIYVLIRMALSRGTGDVIPGVIFIMLSVSMIAFYSLPLTSRRTFNRGFYPWTVLVIDDDRALLKLLESNFRRYGIFVLTAETGEKGLFLADRYRPDLIILDVILPRLKGRAVCSQLKENVHTQDIPVIFLTAKNSMDDVEAEMAAGAHAHITKPVDFKDLFAQVKRILSS